MVYGTLRESGGSVILTIPKSILQALGLTANAKVGLTVANDRLVIDPRPKPRYSLAELIAQCDPAVPAGEEETQWDEAEAVGREAI
jgi:antitoxin ChpS